MSAVGYNEVIVLFNGYSKSDSIEQRIMRANCSCTLIRAACGMNIIVDTMTAWDGELLQRELAAHNLRPEDINVVVCTHGHSDHIGCNYLFREAMYHLVGNCLSHKDQYYNDFFDSNKEFHLEDIRVLQTPGHTLSCVSVVVPHTQLGGTVGICGDLFECSDDIANEKMWLEAGSEDAAAQRRERFRLAGLCDHIVPGHGPMFAITEEMRAKLRQQLIDNNK